MNRPAYWDARFKDLPMFTPKPAAMDDDDVQFHSDIQYMNLLLDDISHAVYSGGRANRLPPGFIDIMATMAAAMNAMNNAISASNLILRMLMLDWRECSRG